MRNGEYAILKSFALLEKTPGVPGMDLPGLNIEALGTGYGLRSVTVSSTESLAAEFKAALEVEGADRPCRAHSGPAAVSGLTGAVPEPCGPHRFGSTMSNARNTSRLRGALDQTTFTSGPRRGRC